MIIGKSEGGNESVDQLEKGEDEHDDDLHKFDGDPGSGGRLQVGLAHEEEDESEQVEEAEEAEETRLARVFGLVAHGAWVSRHYRGRSCSAR